MGVGHTGVNQNGVSFTSGKIASGAFFNNNNSYVDIYPTDDTDIDGDTDMSFSIWAKVAPGDYGYIISKPWNGGGVYNYFIQNSNGGLTFFVAAN